MRPPKKDTPPARIQTPGKPWAPARPQRGPGSRSDWTRCAPTQTPTRYCAAAQRVSPFWPPSSTPHTLPVIHRRAVVARQHAGVAPTARDAGMAHGHGERRRTAKQPPGTRRGAHTRDSHGKEREAERREQRARRAAAPCRERHARATGAPPGRDAARHRPTQAEGVGACSAHRPCPLGRLAVARRLPALPLPQDMSFVGGLDAHEPRVKPLSKGFTTQRGTKFS